MSGNGIHTMLDSVQGLVLVVSGGEEGGSLWRLDGHESQQGRSKRENR